MEMDTPTHEALNRRFSYHKPPDDNPLIGNTHQFIRDKLLVVAQDILDSTPSCMEQCMVMTKLEEAMFWANAAVARHHDHYRPTVAEEGVD